MALALRRRLFAAKFKENGISYFSNFAVSTIRNSTGKWFFSEGEKEKGQNKLNENV